jgi:hypothetical protein
LQLAQAGQGFRPVADALVGDGQNQMRGDQIGVALQRQGGSASDSPR